MVNVFSNGFAVDEQGARDIIVSAVSDHGIKGKWEVSVNFISRSEMLKLHDQKPHQVLAFPLDREVGPDGVIRLGDIVVLGDLPSTQRDKLIAHACLHLLGVHHE